MSKTNIPARHPAGRRAAIIATVCAVVLLALLVTWALALQSGFFLRHNTVIRCGEEKIDTAMFAVYYKENLLILTEGAEGYDPATPADRQPYADGKTWHDHVREVTEQDATRMVVFAAAAGAEGQDTAAARVLAEEYMDAFEAAARTQRISADAYAAARYGKGVRETDVARAAGLYARASLRAAALAEKTYTAAEREAAYTANAADFALADYIAYPVKVDLDGIADPDAMREAYIRAEARAKRIAVAQDEDAFIAAVQADMAGVAPALSAADIRRKTAALYHYLVPAGDTDIAVKWATAPIRAVGDTAVLGATGDYTVVFCLAPADRRTDKPAEAWQIMISYADHATRADAYAAATDRLSRLAGVDGFAVDPLATYLPAAYYGTVEKPIADWLTADRTAGDTAVIEAQDGYAILCYAAPSPFAVWEWQAIHALQEAEYTAMQATYPVTLRSGVTLPQAALTVSSQ